MDVIIDVLDNGSVVTIGQFDGVHLGHQALLSEVVSRATTIGSASVVITFDRHPASLLRPQLAPKLLTSLEQKLELLQAAGIDHVVVLTFDEAQAAKTAEQFVHETLIDRLATRVIVVGHDFGFGRKRQGNAEMLRTFEEFEVIELDVVRASSQAVSSTTIRQQVTQGDVSLAMTMLGRPYEVRGIVVEGDRRGRELGFPTANVDVSTDMLLPADGVYAGSYQTPDGIEHRAAISVGTRPTFYENGINLVEAYLLDFDGDLYGQQAIVRFHERIRGQEKFDSLDALIERITEDVDRTRNSVTLVKSGD